VIICTGTESYAENSYNVPSGTETYADENNSAHHRNSHLLRAFASAEDPAFDCLFSCDVSSETATEDMTLVGQFVVTTADNRTSDTVEIHVPFGIKTAVSEDGFTLTMGDYICEAQVSDIPFDGWSLGSRTVRERPRLPPS